MNFVLQTPSLQHLAGVKIVVHLWNQRDIFTQIAQTFNGQPIYKLSKKTTQWKEMEEKVKSKVSGLSIPESCKKPLLTFIKPLGKQIKVWYNYHNSDTCEFQSIDLDTLLHNQLCWSMHGTVDYAKTAQLMVKVESLAVERRYEIACINCLENEARQLFERLGEEQRQAYINGTRYTEDSSIIYFTCMLSGNVRHLHSCFKLTPSQGESFNTSLLKKMIRVVRISLREREYFFEKLNQREKEQILLEWIEYDMSTVDPTTSDVLYYLPLLNKEQQERMFRQLIGPILILLLDWPMQSLFMEVASRWWHYMDVFDGANVLYDIFERINQLDCQNCDYWHLFWEFWRLISADYHQQFFEFYYWNILTMAKRKEFIQLYFKHVPWRSLKHLVEKRYEVVGHALMDESVISDAALMECKQTALLSSSYGKKDEEKRLRSEFLNRLVDFAIESRIKIREIV